jgi:hypothetical protein
MARMIIQTRIEERVMQLLVMWRLDMDLLWLRIVAVQVHCGQLSAVCERLGDLHHNLHHEVLSKRTELSDQQLVPKCIIISRL